MALIQNGKNPGSCSLDGKKRSENNEVGKNTGSSVSKCAIYWTLFTDSRRAEKCACNLAETRGARLFRPRSWAHAVLSLIAAVLQAAAAAVADTVVLLVVMQLNMVDSRVLRVQNNTSWQTQDDYTSSVSWVICRRSNAPPSEWRFAYSLLWFCMLCSNHECIRNRLNSSLLLV